MAKNLGTVKLNDNEALVEIIKGFNPDLAEYFNTDAVWSEAVDYMAANGVDSAEVRIDGLDFIFVEREKSSNTTKERDDER